MLYSRKKITKAGKKLISSKSVEERNEALELINFWRANHLHPLNVMKNSLLRLLKKNNIKPLIISQRLKRLTSIEYKLDLNEDMGLGGMQDIGGYRAVVKDTKDLYKLKSRLEENSLNHKLKPPVDYVANPKESGYRSIHFVYTYNSKLEKYQDLQLELQIRTKLQHIWATAVETAGIITKTSLKSSQGPDEWLEFFKLVSSLFALKEKLPVLEIHSKSTMEDLMVECYKCTENLKIIDILKAIRVTAKQIEIDKYKGDYYLININLKEKLVNIMTFSQGSFDAATAEYLSLEKEIKDNENAVVLVSAISIKALKKAYPSYFLDTSEFIEALEKINDNCKRLQLI